jgi:hypothetical protein
MKKKILTKQERMEIYNKYGGHCAYCGKEIEYKDMQVDHIKPIFRGWSEEEKQNWIPEGVLGEDNMENLNPSCRMCNFRKSTFTVEGFREQIKHGLVCVNRDFTYRLLKQYGLIEETGKEVVVVGTKADKLNQSGKSKFTKNIKNNIEGKVYLTTTLKKESVFPLVEHIDKIGRRQ